jgi:hypothetical protein
MLRHVGPEATCCVCRGAVAGGRPKGVLALGIECGTCLPACMPQSPWPSG